MLLAVLFLQKLEVFVKENTNALYLYHLEVDFVGIVKEEFYFKNQVKNKYKKIFSMERDDYLIKCENERTDCNKCHTQAKVTYLLDVPDSKSEIEESLGKAINKEKTFGLTITKLAMLGNEHAITFTDWIKNYLCPETNIINYDFYKSMKNEEEDLQILHDSRYT